MISAAATAPPPVAPADSRLRYKPGDLITTATGYPVLYEILAVEAGGLLRVRGVEWAPGYSATVSVDAVRPVTGILSMVT
ncbi:MAG: hypothetical protein IT318_05945 [Anaerolineales bacterium]|nr:hypothetical protein [Anaerolineales bacterium]